MRLSLADLQELGEATRKRDNLQRQVDALEPEIRQFEARRELEKEVSATTPELTMSWRSQSVWCLLHSGMQLVTKQERPKRI